MDRLDQSHMRLGQIRVDVSQFVQRVVFGIVDVAAAGRAVVVSRHDELVFAACTALVSDFVTGQMLLKAFVPLTRSEEHTSELQSLMRISYAVFCLKKKTNQHTTPKHSTL